MSSLRASAWWTGKAAQAAQAARREGGVCNFKKIRACRVVRNVVMYAGGAEAVIPGQPAAVMFLLLEIYGYDMFSHVFACFLSLSPHRFARCKIPDVETPTQAVLSHVLCLVFRDVVVV